MRSNFDRNQVPEVKAAEIRAAFITESAMKGGKANASDFLPEGTSLRAWVREPSASLPLETSPEATLKRSKVGAKSTSVAAMNDQDQLRRPACLTDATISG